MGEAEAGLEHCVGIAVSCMCRMSYSFFPIRFVIH